MNFFKSIQFSLHQKKNKIIMLNSTRKRDSNPPNYIDLERNSIPQLQIILSELGVVPPSTNDRDELIQLIKLKTTPRKQQRRKMYQKSTIDDDSPVESNFSGNDDFNVSNDQYDDAPSPNESIDNSQNNADLNGKDENAPSAESMLADDELSNSAFDADSSIATPQRPSSKLFPSREHPPKIESENEDNQVRNAPDESDTYGWGSTSESESLGWGSSSRSSSRSHSPVRRFHFSPPKQTPPSNRRKENKTNYNDSNKKRVHRNKHQQESKSTDFSIKWLLLIFLLLLLLFFFILALIPLPGESKYLPHCPNHGFCNEKREGNTTRYILYQCEPNYKKITSGLIQICAPTESTSFDNYKYTLDAAAYVSQADGDCFFNHEKIDVEHVKKIHPKAIMSLLTTDNDFLTVLIESDNKLKSRIPDYESTCRAFRACDNNQLLTGLVVILAFIASYVIVKRFSHFFP